MAFLKAFVVLCMLAAADGFATSLRPAVQRTQLRSPFSDPTLSPRALPGRLYSVTVPSPFTPGLGLSQALSKAFSPLRALALLFSAVILRMRGKIAAKVQDMESGWTKRGSGGGFRRTVEVWGFAIGYIMKCVSRGHRGHRGHRGRARGGCVVFADLGAVGCYRMYILFKVQKLKKDKPLEFSAAQTEIAKILTLKLLELGPTFIKLGQLLSTRIDVLPREFINELALLQDQVPGFDGEVAVAIIERELGRPIDQIYDTFERTPIAAASLGQVHRATLGGQEFAVKVQRQGLKELFDMDLKNIKVLARILDKVDPKTDGAQRDWLSIYDESAKLLYREIDYKLEAENAIRFRDNFATVPWIKVPEVYTNMTTTNMVTMEYVPGIKINNIEKIEEAGIDRELLAKRSAESYLMQICRHGFFHCDPHPGNVACDAQQGGRLIYYDFGMMDELKPQVRADWSFYKPSPDKYFYFCLVVVIILVLHTVFLYL
ncbi:ABC1 family-domain-containing protein [Ochromonadaceae sp. CCMP2298]|nr:ABC1 family-domain-containing protein [Ochromonadaceae sp. CCMP2298]